MTARKQPVTPEWIERMFGSARAWQKSRTGFRYVMVGRKRKPAIYCRLLPGRRAGWQLPCPDRPVPEHVRQAVGHAVTGVGERPRLEYEIGGRSEEHTSELQSLMRISYAVFCFKKKK